MDMGNGRWGTLGSAIGLPTKDSPSEPGEEGVHKLGEHFRLKRRERERERDTYSETESMRVFRVLINFGLIGKR